jgi:hypothetical protein
MIQVFSSSYFPFSSSFPSLFQPPVGYKHDQVAIQFNVYMRLRNFCKKKKKENNAGDPKKNKKKQQQWPEGVPQSVCILDLMTQVQDLSYLSFNQDEQRPVVFFWFVDPKKSNFIIMHKWFLFISWEISFSFFFFPKSTSPETVMLLKNDINTTRHFFFLFYLPFFFSLFLFFFI